MKGLARHIGGGAVLVANQSEPVHEGAQLAADSPALIRDALAADWSGAASVPDRMAPRNAIAVGDAHQGGRGQEASRPVLLRMPAAKPAGAFRQLGEEATVVVPESGIESARADAFDGVANADGCDFADGQDGLGMTRRVGDGVIYLAAEFGAKIGDVRGVQFLLWGVCSTQDAGCRGHFQPAL